MLNLDAANPASYPGSGTTWTNLASGGSSLVPSFTINNLSTYNSTSSSINLSSSSSAVASTTSSFGLLSSFTIEVWIKLPTKTDNTGGPFFTERARNPSGNAYGPGAAINMSLSYNFDYGGGVNGGTGARKISSGWHYNGWKGYQSIASNSDIENNWTQIISTFDGTTKVMTLYKNGVQLENPSTLSGGPTVSNQYGYFIGCSWEGSGGVNFGDYAIVNLYSRAITGAEVTTNFNAVKSRFGL